MDKLELIDFSKYEFHPINGIWSKHFRRFCNEAPKQDGYQHVWLKCIDGIGRIFQYHRVIAYMFCPIPEEFKDIPLEDLDVNHKDENRHNNIASNLEWCSTGYNVNYGNGNKRRSETNKKVPHTQEWNDKVAKSLSKQVFQYAKDGTLIKVWSSVAECGRNGFTQSAVCQCCNGKRKYYKGCIWSYNPL